LGLGGCLRSETQGVDCLVDIPADGGGKTGSGEEGQHDGLESHDGGFFLVLIADVSFVVFLLLVVTD
jgi:hypothetical protein